MRLGRIRISPAIVISTVALVVASGGVAVASIPDGSGVIHGCYAKAGGALKVIDTDAGKVCGSKQVPLSWSQTGPAGPAGPEYAASALVLGDGTFQVSSETAGVSASVTHNGPGSWTLTASGLGNTCPLPSLSSWSAGATVAMTGGTCSAGTVTVGVASSTGQDQPWSFSIVGIESSSSSANALGRSSRKLRLGS
jgi:hypothetical protein